MIILGPSDGGSSQVGDLEPEISNADCAMAFGDKTSKSLIRDLRIERERLFIRWVKFVWFENRQLRS